MRLLHRSGIQRPSHHVIVVLDSSDLLWHESCRFDRVSKTYLLAKLFAAGVGTKYLNFLSAYLAPRKGKVVVQGAFSDEISLEDTVFQGTCLGPALWNVFFADVSVPASSTNGREAMFADDLNMFQEFSRSALLPEVMSKMNKC